MIYPSSGLFSALSHARHHGVLSSIVEDTRTHQVDRLQSIISILTVKT